MDDQSKPLSPTDENVVTETSQASKKRAIKFGESSVQNQ